MTEGAALISGLGVVELLVAWLSEGDGRAIAERFKQNQVSFFRKMLHEVSLEGQLSEGQSWQRTLANYADGLDTREPPVRDTSLDGLVAAGLVTVASLTKFGAEALRDTSRHVQVSSVHLQGPPDAVGALLRAQPHCARWKRQLNVVCGPDCEAPEEPHSTRGTAKSVLMIMGARGLHVGDAARQRIEACPDVEMLEHWLVRAATAASAEDIFET